MNPQNNASRRAANPRPGQTAPRHQRRLAGGSTLPELLVVLLVLALLAGLAAPGLQAWALELQLQTTLDELARGLALARTEALATGRVVEFRYRPPPLGQSVAINRSAILFSPTGNATPATLTLCDRRGSGRTLVVARSGRVRAATGQCGFAFAEVLLALFLLALGSLALAQNFLQARHSVASTALHAAALDAITAATEASRLLGPLFSSGLGSGTGSGLGSGQGSGLGSGQGSGQGSGLGSPSVFPNEAAPLFAAWTGTFASSATAGPRLILHWQRDDSRSVWEAAATTTGLRVALEARP